MPDLSAFTAFSTTPTPSPSPSSFNEDSVTPGVVGFAVTAAIVVVVILLIVDMVRRMRRVRYRDEARTKIAAELDAQASAPTPDDIPND